MLKGKKRSANQMGPEILYGDIHQSEMKRRSTKALNDSELADSDAISNDGGLNLEAERCFPVHHEGSATSILRWLRLITLHTCSVEGLVATSTRFKLKELEVKVLQTSLPQADIDMEPLDVCLRRFIPAPED